MKCNHKWIDVPKEGSLSYQDQVCVKCSIKRMQGAMILPANESVEAPKMEPVMRERIEIPVFTGDKTVRVSVFKDDFERQMKKQLGLYPTLFESGC